MSQSKLVTDKIPQLLDEGGLAPISRSLRQVSRELLKTKRSSHRGAGR